MLAQCPSEWWCESTLNLLPLLHSITEPAIVLFPMLHSHYLQATIHCQQQPRIWGCAHKIGLGVPWRTLNITNLVGGAGDFLPTPLNKKLDWVSVLVKVSPSLVSYTIPAVHKNIQTTPSAWGVGLVNQDSVPRIMEVHNLPRLVQGGCILESLPLYTL